MLDALGSALVRTSLEGGLLAGVVWGLCRAVPAIPATARAALWWLVCLKLVVGCLWTSPIELPVLPAAVEAPTVATDPVTMRPPHAALAIAAEPPVQVEQTVMTPAAIARTWGPLVWIGVVLAFVVTLARQWLHTRALVRRAHPVPEHLAERARAVASRMRVTRRVAVRQSAEIDTPQVAGLLRPVVLLPAGAFDDLSASDQEMALAHEMAHVRRGDLWMGIVPALAERLFFFHPLARLAAREYDLAREAACDAEVLHTMHAAPHAYGRLLLTLGVTRGNAIAAAHAARTVHTLKRRLSMLPIHLSARRPWRQFGRLAVAIAACAVLPLELVATDTRGDTAGPAAESTTTKAPVAAGTSPTHRVNEPKPVHAVVVPPPSHRPLVPAPAHAGAGGESRRSQASRDEPWVLFKAGDHGSTSGSGPHRAAAERHRNGSEGLLWFRRGGQEYVVRDPALLQRVEDAFAPLGAIGAEMGALGGRQGALGGRQGEIGAKQGALGSRQGALGLKQGELGARQSALVAKRVRGGLSDQERAALGQELAAVEAEMEGIGRQMEELAREMERLAEPMEDLGRQMEEYGRQMEALGAKMEAAAQRADAELRTLMDEAIRTGRAQAVQ